MKNQPTEAERLDKALDEWGSLSSQARLIIKTWAKPPAPKYCEQCGHKIARGVEK